MFEFEARQLKPGDVFTDDDGETWWKVTSIAHEPRHEGYRIFSECVETQVQVSDLITIGSYQSGLYDADERVVVR